MYDLSKEKDKGFLKEANRWLQEQLLLSKKEVAELRKLKELDEEICTKLSDEIHILRQKFFSNKQEKLKNKPPTKKKKKGNLAHNRNPLSEMLEEKIELDEKKEIHITKEIKCPCGDPDCDLREMKGCFEESSEIEVTERKYTLKRHQRQKYTGTTCGKITTAPGKEKLVPGGDFSIQMGVQVVCDKFERHLPLERQRKEMKRSGLIVDTKTLFGLSEHVYNHLMQIPLMIKSEIFERFCVHIDESPFTFFNPNKSRGYVWSLSNNYGVYYQFEPSRAGEVAKELLLNFEGAAITDGYKGYDWINESEKIIHALCWAHVRRKFYESMGNYPKAEEMVDLIDDLYDIEHEAHDFKHLKILRETKSSKKIKEIEEWIDDLEGKYLKSSSIGKAINYLKERKKGLKEFLTNVYIPIDNNTAERAQRDPVMGRKNYQFFKSINGADVAMLFYAIMGTCKILGVNAKTYLLEMTLRSARGEKLETPYQYGQKFRDQAKKEMEEAMGELPQAP